MADLDDLEIGPDASDLAEPTPKGPFMPAPEDRSYIANEYRVRVAEIAALKAENAKLRAGLEEISRVEWVRMTYVDDKQWMEALVRALNSNAAVARKALGRE